MAQFDTTTKSIKEWMENTKKNNNIHFIIPEYQRPYAWELENCEQLWADIKDAFNTRPDSYFLGPIVTNGIPDSDDISIIDGQQRLTTLTLLLRALCTHLERRMASLDTELTNQKNSGNFEEAFKTNNDFRDTKDILEKILPLIFYSKKDDNNKLIIMKDEPKLDSEVLLDDEKDKLYNILIHGTIKTEHIDPKYKKDEETNHSEDSNLVTFTYQDPFNVYIYKSENRYTGETFYKHFNLDKLFHGNRGKIGVAAKLSKYNVNYAYFCAKIKDFALDRSISVLSSFVDFILTKCNIIELRCETPDDALLIFNTLNNRGLPLSEADIIKSQYIYNRLTQDEKKDLFPAFWNNFSEMLSKLHDESSGYKDDACVYKHFMFWHWARPNKQSYDTKELNNLKKYYKEHSDKMPKGVSFLDEIESILKFHLSIAQHQDTYCTNRANLYLDCLKSYTGTEIWRYLLTIFYMKFFKPFDSNVPSNIKNDFELFLEHIMIYMFINELRCANRKDYEKWCADLCRQLEASDSFDFNTFKAQSTNLLNLNTDINGNPIDLLNVIKELQFKDKSCNWIIKLYSYLSSNFTQPFVNEDSDLEHIYPKSYRDPNSNDIGNLILLEHQINVSIGNTNLNHKLGEYEKSKYMEVRQFASVNKNKGSWTATDISTRSEQIATTIMSYFSKQCSCHQ